MTQVLVVVAFILAIIALVRSQGSDLVAWGVLALSIALGALTFVRAL